MSGARATIENMVFQILQQQMMQTIQQYPEDAKEIIAVFQTIAKESLTVDDVIKKLLPVYRKHYTIE